MSYKKPCRICNNASFDIPSLEKPDLVTATLKELKSRYELRICIPAVRHDAELSVFIWDNSVQVFNQELNQDHKKTDSLLFRFLLPSNVLTLNIRALKRPYGLNVILPKKPHENKEERIRVPLETQA